MVQVRVLFGAELHFFILQFKKHYSSAINIIIISEILEHMFYNIKMANRSPFQCPKILFGPFRWLMSFSG